MKTLSVILPAYNEIRRLPRTFELLKQAKSQGIFKQVLLETIWVVDDGSKDGTAEYVEKMRAELPELRVHPVRPNQGKGNAIHEGLKVAQSEWCLIADADSATPWDQFNKLYSVACPSTQSIAYPIVIGSRDVPGSERRIKQSWIRENLGRLFNLAIRIVTGLPFKDTQCGFKLVHRPSVISFLEHLQIKRFAWDVEFLMFAQAKKLAILEVPVAWEHQEDSRINPLKDGIEMFLRVLQMRSRLFFTEFKND